MGRDELEERSRQSGCGPEGRQAEGGVAAEPRPASRPTLPLARGRAPGEVADAVADAVTVGAPAYAAAAAPPSAARAGERGHRKADTHEGRGDPAFAALVGDVRQQQVTLTLDEERRLIAAAKTGDAEAQERLARSCLKLVMQIARRHARDEGEWADVISAGNEGLAEACRCRTFDASFGLRFGQYASAYVRKYVYEHVTKRRFPHVPVRRGMRAHRVLQIRARLEGARGGPVSDEEVAQLAQCTVAQVREATELDQHALELDAPIAPDAGAVAPAETVSTTVGAPWNEDEDQLGAVDRAVVQRRLLAALREIPQRQAEVLCLLFGIGQFRAFSVGEVAARIGVPDERVRRLRDAGLKALGERGDLLALR